jgi:hypothetical protein
MFRGLLLLFTAVALLLPGTSSARLTRLVVTQTVPLAQGVSWGSTGPYERLTGTAYSRSGTRTMRVLSARSVQRRNSW